MSRMLVSIGLLQVLIMAVSFFRVKVFTVLLGPANYGVVGAVDQTVQSLAQLCAISIPFTAMKFMSQRHSEGHDQFERTYATFFRALVGVAVIAVAAVAVLIATNPGILGKEVAAYRNYFVVAVIGVPAVMLNIFFMNTLASAQRGAASAMLNLAVLLTLAVAALIGYFADGIMGLYIATVVAGVVTSAGTLWYLHRSLRIRISAHGAGIIAELRQNPQIVTYSLLVYVALSAYSLTMITTRYFVINELGEVSAGIVAALLSIALTVSAVMMTMNNLYFIPHVNRALPPADKIAAANEFARKMLVLMVLAGVSIALFPKLVITLVSSREYTAGATSLFMFICWQCLLQTVNVYMQLLIGLDDVAFYSATIVVGYGVSAVMFPSLISRFGLSGAAIALMLAMLVCALAAAARLRMKFGRGIDGATVIRGVYCLAAISGAGLLFRSASEGTAAGIAMRAGYFAAAIIVLWFTLDAGERALATAGVTFAREQSARFRRKPV